MGGPPISDSSTPVIQRLLEAYRALAEHVPPDVSRTARLIRRGQVDWALERMREEIGELLEAWRGRHGHSDAKRGLAERLLAERGLPAQAADLLLEATEVSYWWIVSRFASGAPPDAAAIERALRTAASDGSAESLAEAAAAAARNPSEATVYGLIARALGAVGLPPHLFVELDLLDMTGRPYLREVLRAP